LSRFEFEFLVSMFAFIFQLE